MARTAPVPDIPPIPGMNPGVVVAGGGGGSGGDGGGDGSAGSGNAGANGENGGSNAGGDGKGAGNCGQGGQGGCPQHHPPHAGDPVDAVSGEVFTLPATDLALPGLIEMHFDRVYTAHNRDIDVGLGYGWGHSFAWQITVGTYVIVRKGLGAEVEFVRRDQVGAEAYAIGGWMLRREQEGFCLHTTDDFLHYFRPVDATGTRHRLSAIVHGNGNSLRFAYDEKGRLSEILDSVGRAIRVESNREGRIASLSIKDPASGRVITYARYLYDESGNLVTHVNADGATTRYFYDDEHRITRYVHPNGLTFHFVYDKKGRCVETWGDYPGSRDPALADDLPKFLADGTTRAKGIYHVRLTFGPNGFSEVADSVRHLRFFVNARGQVTKGVGANGGVFTRSYDDWGRMISLTDALGATTTYEYDVRGRLIRETDALGRSFQIIRDQSGRVVQNIDYAGGVIDSDRDSRGNVVTVVNQRGFVTTSKFDDRSLLTEQIDPNGARTTYEADPHANLTKMTLPNGTSFQWKWDYFGRPIERTDPKGGVSRYTYSDMGKLLRCEHPGSKIVEWQWDGMGCYTARIDSNGTTHYRWGGLRWMCGRTGPDGDEINYRYNYEGWMTQIVNQHKEVTRQKFDASGMVVEIEYFDGSRKRYGWDKMHRLAWLKNSLGETTTVERDVLGRVMAVTYPDDTTESVEYNARDEVIRVVGPGGEVASEFDPCGNLVREVQKSDGATHWIQSTFDEMNRRIAMSTSQAYLEVIKRDAMGNRARVTLNQDYRVDFQRDALGFVTRQVLPRGGVIETDWDDCLRITRRRVLSPSIAVPATEGEPEWIGARPGNAVIDKAFGYRVDDELVQSWDNERGATSYHYDGRKRLLSKIPSRGVEEHFRPDAASNIHEAGPNAPRRVYEQGNRLVSRANARYCWDQIGRLTEKRITKDDGTEDVWRYAWNGQGMLSQVIRPDEVEVEFLYDPYGRRTVKRVKRPTPSGELVLTDITRYVWDGHAMIHEIREGLGPRGKFERTRVFSYDDVGLRPWAQEDRRPEGNEWLHFVGDIIDAPEQLVAADGTVACRLERTAWGVTRVAQGSRTSTPIRFAGQYEDEETGLAYNINRYYDPEVGRYISPDPIGIRGGENLFMYAPNPIGWVDPLGLQHTCSVSLQRQGTAGPDTPNTDCGRPGGGPGVTSGHGGADNPRQIPGCNGGPPTGTPTANNSQATSHTEMHATEWAEHHFPRTLGPGGADPLHGSNMNLGGQHPPCAMCSSRMQKFSEDHNATVHYNWPVNNRVAYQNGVGPTAVSHQGHPIQPEADRLASASGTSPYSRAVARRNSQGAPGTDMATQSHSDEYERQMAARAPGANPPHPCNNPDRGGHVDDTHL